MLDSTWLHYVHLSRVFAELRAARGTLVTTIYDLVPLLYPDVVAKGMSEAFEAWFRRALLESDGLICISRAVADDVIGYVKRHDLPVRDGLRIGWWHLGSDIRPTPEDGEVRAILSSFFATMCPPFSWSARSSRANGTPSCSMRFERLWADGSPARLLSAREGGLGGP